MKTIEEISEMISRWISEQPFAVQRSYSVGARRKLAHDLHRLQTNPIDADGYKLHIDTLRRYVKTFNIGASNGTHV